MGMLVTASKDITSVQDVMTGDQPTNRPATTTLAMIEQGQKVMTGIFKRIYRSFGKELRVLFGLNGEYLDDEEYFVLDPAGGDVQKIERQDYNDKDLGVMPVADPNVITDMQKLARSEAEWQSFNGDPLINQVELRRNRMAAIGTPDPDTMLQVPRQGPNPALLLAMAKEARAKALDQAKIVGSYATAADMLSDAAMKLNMAGLVDDAASLAGAAEELGGIVEADIGGTNGNPGPGGVPPVEGQPADAGVPGGPQAAPAGVGGPVVPGGVPQPGAAGSGGPVGPVGGGQS
jgi:chaperonin GroES